MFLRLGRTGLAGDGEQRAGRKSDGSHNKPTRRSS
jgi:hypothetical protein